MNVSAEKGLEVFNLQNLFQGCDSDLHDRFQAAMPYPHSVMPDAINAEFAHLLFSSLNSLPFRWRRVKESFYEHEVCNLEQLAELVGGELLALKIMLQDPALVSRLSYLTGAPPSQLLSLTGHRLYHGDRIDSHNDDAVSGEFFRLLLFIDPEPKFSGGVLLLQEEVGSHLVARARVPYVPFQVYLFRFAPNAYHAVTPVEEHVPGANRLTLLATYGTKAGAA
jgi:hypothetical protein